MRLIAGLLALVAGFASFPSAVAASQSLPWSAPATTKVVTEERGFENGDTRLSGTLHMPARRAPVAAVVVAHSASSPLRSASLYDHLKTALPALGIAVFAYDRRGSGQSGTKTAGGDFTLLADDAIAAVQSLKADPRIDPKRVGIWGLSQGGWIGPLAASRSPDIAFVIAVSAPVVTADVQMLFSSTNHLVANGHSRAEIDQMTATRKAVDDYMRGSGSREAAQKMIDAAKAQPWFKYTYMGETVRDRAVSGWRREIENDPLKNLSAVTVPTLVLYGADDAVVPVAISLDRLQAIAAQMPNMEVHSIAGADHAMAMSVDRTISLDPKHDGTERPDSEEYLALLASWLARQGLVAN
ncbi:MAG: alpha/beta fold hydrolase [Sphingopyxis sp.]|uniref:alpha/beta hydrolase family protein n=1 Tax=Sphingopyxis sp. TaxID=1908224 RepID=UPI001A20440E|nr:alpha/beta fold hydrolase [Sphingopyxis sp.]MBJ7501549.1 alpha/beta fold hydrolase [Sphingopyxis sp.]